MKAEEIIEEWENTFETAFLGEADNPEHIRVLFEALVRRYRNILSKCECWDNGNGYLTYTCLKCRRD